MNTSQLENNCQESNSRAITQQNDELFPIESLRFPVDKTMQIVFTGYYTGFSVEVRSPEEVALLYHMGCFGKGSFSRSKPRVSQSNDSPNIIMRKRQFQKRNYWFKKFGGTKEQSEESDAFFKDIDELAGKMKCDGGRTLEKDVIDLVSSDEELSMEQEELEECNGSSHMESCQSHDKENVVVIVPNSDSEEENYFANMMPKCCVNKIKLNEKLMLTLQEALFLVYGLGCLQVVGTDNRLLNIQKCWDLFSQTDSNFVSKYVVYHYFRSKGYIVKPGIKFGGDYLLYREGPGVQHADFIVVIKYDEDFNWISVLGHVRMSVTTVKEILIAEVIKPLGEYQKLPENLRSYSVQETLLNRKIPVTINNEE